MNIKGEKVLLRAIEPQDSEMLLQMINDEEMEFMIGGWSFPISRSNQEEWINNLKNEQNILRCAINYQGEAVGTVILSEIDFKNGNAEIHIKISNDKTGKGLGTDAILALTNYAFKELRLKCVFARVNEHNTPSLHLFSKCGFEKEGLLRKRIYKRGTYINVFSLSKINDSL